MGNILKINHFLLIILIINTLKNNILFYTTVNACFISQRFSHAYTSLLYGVHALEKHVLLKQAFTVIYLNKFEQNEEKLTKIENKNRFYFSFNKKKRRNDLIYILKYMNK